MVIHTQLPLAMILKSPDLSAEAKLVFMATIAALGPPTPFPIVQLDHPYELPPPPSNQSIAASIGLSQDRYESAIAALIAFGLVTE